MQNKLSRMLRLAMVMVMVLCCIFTTVFASGVATDAVAVNTTTGAQYDNLADALLEAVDGEVVQLQQDAQDTITTVFENITLDLNGNTLTTNYMTCFGDLVDTSADNAGLLCVADSRFMLQESNSQLPVKTAEGYRLAALSGFNKALVNSTKYVFQPLFETAAHELLAQGSNATGVQVQVHVSWKQGEGTRYQTFSFNDSHLQGFLASYKAESNKYSKQFALTLMGAEALENLTFSARIVSDTGVVFQAANSVVLPEGSVEVDEENKLVGDTTLESAHGTAYVAAGTQLNAGVTKLTLATTPMANSGSGLETSENEQLTSLDVHIEGIAADNAVPVIVTLNNLAPEFLNQGNITLYHVENGQAVEMQRVFSLEEVDAHNEYYYDIATGTITLAMSSFSEVAVVSEAAAWEGKYDYSWYTNAVAPLSDAPVVYKIYNADQLAGLSAIVGGMEGQTQDSFAGKTIMLMADIDLADGEEANDPNKIFYPIGYYNSDYKYEKTGIAITSSFRTFEGTFDGNGHTIKNIYQNTWEMKGDHEWYDATLQYYRDGMGLFGKVYGGTVKNLTIDNFKSDGEITTTGCVASYADCGAIFENITITNCNPRVYNIGNGGIVGCVGWYARETAEKPVIFRNITVDASNKISALWGSWGVSCGGILGQYYPTSGQSYYNYPANPGVTLENCHVAAQIDVNNDVCSNYQYYLYRYAGMLIGSIRENVTIDGKIYPKMDGITAKDCTVLIGNWKNYYYCEIVANSLASYTHDHQFSRLTGISALSEIYDEASKTWTQEGHFIIVGADNMAVNPDECFHIMKNSKGELYRHFHDVADESNPDIYETFDLNGDGELNDLKEDRQRYYIPFDNQLVTGDGMGVNHYGLNELEGVKSRIEGESCDKFLSNADGNTYAPDTVLKVSDLFQPVSNPKISVYQNNVQVFVSAADEQSTVSGTYTPAGDWTQGTLALTGTGNATVTISDYYFCNPKTIRITVAKNPATVTAAPTAVQDLVYTGAAQELVTAGTAQGGTLVYSLNGSEYSETIPTGTGAGIYTVYYKVQGDESHVDSDVGTVTVSIGKATPSVTTVPTGLTATYGQTLADVALTDGWSWKDSSVSVGNAGTNSFTAVYTPDDTDNYNTVEVSVSVEVTRDPVVKFAHKFPNTASYLYRVGNVGTVSLDTLFKAVDGATINSAGVTVTIESVDGTAASGEFTDNNTWTSAYIQFSGTGVVKVTVTDNDYCKPTELYLEVVDATNATAATSATANNVVLLKDVGFSSIEVSGGYTLYGNGFKMTCSSDRGAKYLASGFLTMENGVMDNVQIICPNFSNAILYTKNFTENNNPTDADGKYYNVCSAVYVTGNSNKILNSYICGGRAAVYATSGTLLIENSTIEGGAAANIHTGACNLTLKDATLIQEPKQATVHDTSKTLMGLSVIAMCDGDGLCSPITLEGTLKQYAWACEDYKTYVPSDGQSFVTYVLTKTDYIHKITYSDGAKDSLNLGVLFMPSGSKAPVEPVNNGMIIDKRTDATTKPYESVSINGSAYVYSYKNSNGTAADMATKPGYVPQMQTPSMPKLSFADINDSRVFETTYDQTRGWISSLTVDVDQGNYSFSFADLLAQKYGQNLNYTVTTADGAAVDKTATITLNAAVTNEYVLTITDDQIYDSNGQKIPDASVTQKYTFMLLATKTSLPAPEWKSTTLTGTPYIVVDTKNSDWNCAVPVLDGMKVTYWSKKQGKLIENYDLSSISFDTLGLQNGTNNSITITVEDEFTLTITTTGFKTNDNGKPVVVAVDSVNKLYFTVSSSSNYVSTSTTSRTPSISYSFTDANNSDPINATTSMTVTYADYKSNQYKYSSFCNGTLEAASSGCFTGDTLITLADGSQKRIDQVTYDDMLMTWDFYKGEYAVVPAAVLINHGEGNYDSIRLVFENGTEINILESHAFFNVDTNEWVYIDAKNVADYVGSSFVCADADTYTTTKLVDYEVSKKCTVAYSIFSAFNYNCFAENMLTLTPSMFADSGNYYVPFEVGTDLKYDEAKMQADIEKYGLYTYEDFAEYVTYEQYVGFNAQYFKVSVGKGLITYERLIESIYAYVNPQE